jgi:hypothetical protein
MKTRTLRFLAAPIVLMSAWPAMASLAPSAPRPAAQVLIAEADAPVTDQADTTQRARAELQVWRGKLDEYGASAKDSAEAARKSGSDELNKAWAKAKAASDRLETASAADWQDAKASFKEASDELAATWTKFRADLK